MYLLSEIFSSFKNSPQRQYVAQEEYQDDKGEDRDSLERSDSL
jgi:hypothetical protein